MKVIKKTVRELNGFFIFYKQNYKIKIRFVALTNRYRGVACLSRHRACRRDGYCPCDHRA